MTALKCRGSLNALIKNYMFYTLQKLTELNTQEHWGLFFINLTDTMHIDLIYENIAQLANRVIFICCPWAYTLYAKIQTE